MDRNEKSEEPVVGEPELKGSGVDDGAVEEAVPVNDTFKSRWERSWPTIACGAGLFSDGYLNGVCRLFGVPERLGVSDCQDQEI